MNLEQKLKQAEDLVSEVRKEIQQRDAVKPVFPEEGYVLFHDGGISSSVNNRGKARKQGNTFYSTAEATKESLRRAAEVRVREAINLANKGDNGFKVDEPKNIYIFYSYSGRHLITSHNLWTQQQNSWEYIRTKEAAKKLIANPEFEADWKIMKNIYEK